MLNPLPSQTVARHPDRPRRRWPRRLVLAALGLVLAAAAFPWWFPERWLGRLLAYGAGRAGYPCRVETARFRWPARITLENVAVAELPISLLPEPQTDSGSDGGATPAAARAFIDRLTASVHIGPLLRGRVEGLSAEIAGARLFVPAPAGFPLPEMADSDAAPFVRVDIPDLQATASLPGRAMLRGRLVATPGRLDGPSGEPPRPAAWPWRATLALDPLTAHVDIPNGDWTLLGARVALDGVRALLEAAGAPGPARARLAGEAVYDPAGNQASLRLAAAELDAPAWPSVSRQPLAVRLSGAFRLTGLGRPPAELSLEWEPGRAEARAGGPVHDALPFVKARWEAWNPAAAPATPSAGAASTRGDDSALFYETLARGAALSVELDAAGLGAWLAARPLSPEPGRPELPDPFGFITVNGQARWTAGGPSGSLAAVWTEAPWAEAGQADGVGMNAAPGDPAEAARRAGARPLAALSGAGAYDVAAGAARVDFLHFWSESASARWLAAEMTVDPPAGVLDRFDLVVRPEMLALAECFRPWLPEDAQTALTALNSSETRAALTGRAAAPPSPRPTENADPRRARPAWMDAGAAPLFAASIGGAAAAADKATARIRGSARFVDFDSAPASLWIEAAAAPRAGAPEGGIERLLVTIRSGALDAARAVSGLFPPPAAAILDALADPETRTVLALEDGAAAGAEGGDEGVVRLESESPRASVRSGARDSVLAVCDLRGLVWNEEECLAQCRQAAFALAPLDARLNDIEARDGGKAATIGVLDIAVRPEAAVLAGRLSPLLPPEAHRALALLADPEMLALLALPPQAAAEAPIPADAPPPEPETPAKPALLTVAGRSLALDDLHRLRAAELTLFGAPAELTLRGVSADAAAWGAAPPGSGAPAAEASYLFALRPDALAVVERLRALLPESAGLPALDSLGLELRAEGAAAIGPAERLVFAPGALLAAEWRNLPGDAPDGRLRVRHGGSLERAADGRLRLRAAAGAGLVLETSPIPAAGGGRNSATADFADADVVLAPAPDLPLGWKTEPGSRADVALRAHARLKPFLALAARYAAPSRLETDFLPWYDADARIDLGLAVRDGSLSIVPREAALDVRGTSASGRPDARAIHDRPVLTFRAGGEPITLDTAAPLRDIARLAPFRGRLHIDGRAEDLCFLLQRWTRSAPPAWLGLPAGDADAARARLAGVVESVLARGEVSLAVEGGRAAGTEALAARFGGIWRGLSLRLPNAGRTAYDETLLAAPQAGGSAAVSWDPALGLRAADVGFWAGEGAAAPWLLVQLARPDGPPLAIAPAGGGSEFSFFLRPEIHVPEPGRLARLFPGRPALDSLRPLSGAASLAVTLRGSPAEISIADGTLRFARDFAYELGEFGRIGHASARVADLLTFSARVFPPRADAPATPAAWTVTDGRVDLAGPQWRLNEVGYALGKLEARFDLRDGLFRLDPFDVIVHPSGIRASQPDIAFSLMATVDLNRPVVPWPAAELRLRLRNLPLPDMVSPFFPPNIALARGRLSVPDESDAWTAITLVPAASADAPPELVLDHAGFEIRDLGVVVTLSPEERAMLAKSAMVEGAAGGALKVAAALVGGDSPDSSSSASVDDPDGTLSLERVLRFDPQGRRAIGFSRIHGGVLAPPGGGLRVDPDRPIVFEGNQSPHFVVTGDVDWRLGQTDAALDLEVRIARNLRRLLDYDGFLRIALGNVLGAGTRLSPERRGELSHEIAQSMERRIDAGELRFPIGGMASRPDVATGLVGLIQTLLIETVKDYMVKLPQEMLFQEIEDTLTRQLSGQQ